MQKPLLLLLALFALTALADTPARHVDPRIGSVGVGRTFPGPTAPFGMAKPGPDGVTMPNAGWAPMPEAVKGFSQTHVSGTGGGQKYGNVLIQPLLKGAVPTTKGLLMPDGRIAQIPVYARHRQTEDIALGYYSCTYDDGIKTEITTDDRSAVYRFTHARALFVDAASFLGMDTIPNKREAQQFVGSALTLSGPSEISGRTTVRGGWNNGGPYTVYFCLQSSAPFTRFTANDSLTALAEWTDRQTEPITLHVGISYVSIDQARHNITPLSFDAQRASLCDAWDGMLRAVSYEGNQKEMRMFYTALYHTLLMPIDKTGEGWGGTPDVYYDDYYAIWDTYRTSFPLLMEYYPERATDMVNAMLNIYQREGYLPDARSGDCNGRTQGGSNAEVVIAEAFARGLKGIDYALALKAMIKDAEVPPADDEKEGRGGLTEYNTLGYIPYGTPRAGTRTVEYSYDDWCIAQVAKGLGKKKLYKKYMARSRNWRNLWRADYQWQGMRGFIMPRDANGQWLDSVTWGRSAVFRPKIAYRPDTKVGPWNTPWWDTFFYEALSAEYSLSIPHDVPALIELCGGKEAFRQRLDTFFDNGHYNVGNEPSFLTPYLYTYIGRTDLTNQRIAAIVRNNYSDTPDGLPGNDDSGAMSSWLIYAMLGRYPVAGQGKYIHFEPVRIGEPTAQDAQAFDVFFTINRQYRTWHVTLDGLHSAADTLRLRCHDNTYLIPRTAVAHATGFCWDSPYRTGNTYPTDGTFLFISDDALKQLKATDSFIYDEITWRKVDSTDREIHVRADIDDTEMWIDTQGILPLVTKMKGNPLGIDWEVMKNNPDSTK